MSERCGAGYERCGAGGTSAAALETSAAALDLGSGSGRVGPPGRVGPDLGSGQARKIKIK